MQQPQATGRVDPAPQYQSGAIMIDPATQGRFAPQPNEKITGVTSARRFSRVRNIQDIKVKEWPEYGKFAFRKMARKKCRL